MTCLGIHAREWISPAVATYMVDRLTYGLSESTDPALVENLEWHFLPVVNPDGYAYTRTSDRLWRKTR